MSFDLKFKHALILFSMYLGAAFCSVSHALDDRDVLFLSDLDKKESVFDVDTTPQNKANPEKDMLELTDKKNRQKAAGSTVENSPRKFLLQSIAKENSTEAFLNRNYINPQDRMLLEEKKLYNLDVSREEGQKIISGPAPLNTSRENSLSSSFSSSYNLKPRDKKEEFVSYKDKDYKKELEKVEREKARLAEEMKKKSESNYESQAESLRGNFFKKNNRK